MAKNGTIRRAALQGGFLALGMALGAALVNMQDDGGQSLSTPAHAVQTLDLAPSQAPPIEDVVERISPAVVSVGAVKSFRYYNPQEEFFSRFFMIPPRASTGRAVMPYLGSGFLIDKEGHILTNHHVIEDSDQVIVTLQDGREFQAEVLDADRYIDLALLKVDVPSDELPEPLKLGDSNLLRIGQRALALGNPFGNLIADPHPTVTSGVVSALNRSFQPNRRERRVYHDMIQTDAAINPGNSGGPLVDEFGRVIGINTFILTGGGSGGSVGMGFAIPVDRAQNFVNEIKEHGHVRPLLRDFDGRGVAFDQVSGVYITDVTDSGPASRAGLRPGDIVVEANGRKVRRMDDMLLILGGSQVGDELKLKVWRNGKTRDVAYYVSEAPDA